MKIIWSKVIQKRIDHVKHCIKNEVKAPPKRAIQNTAEKTSDLIGHKIVDKATRFSKTSQKNNPETIEEEILTEKYTFPKRRQNITDDPRLI